MNTTKLFSDFAPVSKAQWKAKAIEDLKGADFDKKLAWKTDDGFVVQPFYTAEDMQGLEEQYKMIASPARKWINYVEIPVEDVQEANSTVHQLKQFDANGFLFKVDVEQPIDFAALLHDIDPSTHEISFSLNKPSVAFCRAYTKYLEENVSDQHSVKGFIECDMLEQWSTTGVAPAWNEFIPQCRLFGNYPNLKCLVIRSHAFVNAGATTSQELAFTFNKLADYIDHLLAAGFDIKAVEQQLVFHFAVGGDYFFEIAKLRACRILLKEILQLCGAGDNAVTIISSNSTWSKSMLDANVNLLRNTSEAMSAILGGCDALLTYAHDASYNQPTDFSRRIALNISNILKEESYFDKVADPAAGSYYIENLTRSLAENALTLFKNIEQEGGYISCFEKEIIQDNILQVKAKKDKEISTCKRVYVGSNKYPLREETFTTSAISAGSYHGNLRLLTSQRATKAFEEFRDRTTAYFNKTGILPTVFVASFGNVTLRKARAAFSSEFFALAGFNVLDEYFSNDLDEVVKQSLQSNAGIVVLCASDDDYALSAAAFARSFKLAAKDKLLVLAGYPEAIIDELTAAGFDEFIHIKTNAIEVLAKLQKQLLV